jgi:hypothetical protein
MTDIQIINPIEFDGWDDAIAPLPGSSFFHTSAWAKVLSESYGYKPTYFALFQNGGLAGVLPVMDVNSILTGHCGVSLPFTDFCEPISDDRTQFHALFEHALSHGKRSRWKYIELRGGKHLLSDTLPSQVFFAHIVDLSPDEKRMMAGFRDSTRRNIKKAAKEGVEVRILRSLESIKEFYRLNCMTRKEHGLPPQPYRFFSQVHKHVITKGLGVIALAYFQGEPIAGNVYFYFGRKAVFKYGASNRKYQNLRANNLLMWEAIKWHSLNGYNELHFGRTERGHKGLRQFKDGWGANEYSIEYFKYDLHKDTFIEDNSNVTSFHNSIFRKTPIPLLKIAGSLFYGHMP